MNFLTPAPIIKRAAAILFLFGTASLFAHYTWLSPTPSAVKIGETVIVLLANGHSFPAGDEPVSGLELKMAVTDPSGQSAVLSPADKGRGLEASFTAATEGVYRVSCEYDRGIISRTPDGWKPGGRSLYPNAASVLKSYNSFLCTFRTNDTPLRSSEPLGLTFEISWSREGGRLVVRATSQNKPVEGADISVIFGSGDSKPAGKTDSSGRAAIDILRDFKGPILLIGSISKQMPAGSDFDAERTSSSFFLNWE